MNSRHSVSSFLSLLRERNTWSSKVWMVVPSPAMTSNGWHVAAAPRCAPAFALKPGPECRHFFGDGVQGRGLECDRAGGLPQAAVEVSMQEYRNDKIVVRYDPKICIHAGDCVRGLPSVFDVAAKPWIDVNGAAPEA